MSSNASLHFVLCPLLVFMCSCFPLIGGPSSKQSSDQTNEQLNDRPTERSIDPFMCLWGIAKRIEYIYVPGSNPPPNGDGFCRVYPGVQHSPCGWFSLPFLWVGWGGTLPSYKMYIKPMVFQCIFNLWLGPASPTTPLPSLLWVGWWGGPGPAIN